jgi:hypothetical protein
MVVVLILALQVATTSGGGDISPSAFVSYQAHGAPQGPYELDLLVIWRSAPGLFRGRDASSSIDVTGHLGLHSLATRQGTYALHFDGRKRTVAVEGVETPLGDANVVLVEVQGPRAIMVGLERVAPTFADSPIEPVIRQSQRLFDFIRCETFCDRLMPPR